MLKKFVAVKNIGTFRNHGSVGDIEHRQLTLIHAENARGKTTMCAILRSLRDGDANRILERRTIDGVEAPIVKLLLESGPVEFKNGAWDATHSNIEIFDADFVTENVYSGDQINHSHKCNLCRVVLGADGVKLAERIDALDAEERTAGAALSTAKGAAQKCVPLGMSLETFIELPIDEHVDEKIERLNQELALMASSEAIARHPTLVPLVLPDVPSDIESVLCRTIEGISSNAATAVREHIQNHIDQNGTRLSPEEWLAAGVRILRSDACPMCAQTLAYSPIIDAMRAYFSREYRQFQSELVEFVKRVRTSLSAQSLLGVQRVCQENNVLGGFWREYARISPDNIVFETEVQPVVEALRTALEPLLEKKTAMPLDAVPLNMDVIKAMAGLETLRARADTYNEFVRSANVAITEVKARAAQSNCDKLRGELFMLEAKKTRHEKDTLATLLVYTAADAEKTRIELAKEQARKDLNDYNAGVMSGYQDKVNHLLTRFGANFRLCIDKRVNYTGGTPRVTYYLEIRGVKVDLGSDKTPPGTPCFRNTLSMGDRNTLALALFVAQLKARSDLANLVVVFDDPFTSLDAFRQQWTCMEIRRMAESARQVIVLSHSLEFLRKVSERCKFPIKTLQIARHCDADSHIIDFDLNDATISQVEHDIVTMRGFLMGEHHDAVATVRCIRPVLESHMRKMAPEQCPEDNGWLGNFLGQIKAADESSSLAIFKKNYDDYDSLNEYTSPYAHDSNISPDLNHEELKAQVQLAMLLIGREWAAV